MFIYSWTYKFKRKAYLLLLFALSSCVSAPKSEPKIVNQGDTPTKFAVVKVNLNDYGDVGSLSAATEIVRPFCEPAPPVLESQTDKAITDSMAIVRVARGLKRKIPIKINYRYFRFKCSSTM